MEIISLILSEDNVRTLIVLFAILYGVMYLEKSFDKKIDQNEKKLDRKLDERDRKLDENFAKFYETLKNNDFAHLNRTIKALTFTLEKNKVLNSEDKKHIDSHWTRSRELSVFLS